MPSLGRLSHRFFLFVCVQLNLSVYLSVCLGSCLIQFFPGSLSVGLSFCFCFLVCLSDCMFGCLTVCLSLLSVSVYLSSLSSFNFLKFLCIQIILLWFMGNCVEQLPEISCQPTIGKVSAYRWPTVHRNATDALPTRYRQLRLSVNHYINCICTFTAIYLN